LHQTLLRARTLRWFLTTTVHDKFEAAIMQRSLRRIRALLADYFQFTRSTVSNSRASTTRERWQTV